MSAMSASSSHVSPQNRPGSFEYKGIEELKSLLTRAQETLTRAKAARITTKAVKMEEAGEKAEAINEMKGKASMNEHGRTDTKVLKPLMERLQETLTRVKAAKARMEESGRASDTVKMKVTGMKEVERSNEMRTADGEKEETIRLVNVGMKESQNFMRLAVETKTRETDLDKTVTTPSSLTSSPSPSQSISDNFDNLQEEDAPELSKNPTPASASEPPALIMGGIHPSSSTLSVEHSLLELVPRLDKILQDENRKRLLMNVPDDDAQVILDLFQFLLDFPQLKIKFRSRLLLATRELSKNAGLLPQCYELRDINVDDDYVTGGGFADIFKGDLNGNVVCLKAIRIYQKTDKPTFMKNISKEAVIWAQLDHPNILKMLGIYRHKSRICLVSPWMEAGDLVQYLEHRPLAPRRHLAMDVAQGLKYLHDNGVIHGDLKGANVLIDNFGLACVADFGLSSLPTILNTQALTSAFGTGTPHWTAPELFEVEETEDASLPKPTMASDMYSWACVCYEIFVGKRPFWNIHPTTISIHVKAGGRPEQPHESHVSWESYGLDTTIWSIMEDCWKMSPDERPEIEYAMVRLTAMLDEDTRSSRENTFHNLPLTRWQTSSVEITGEIALAILENL